MKKYLILLILLLSSQKLFSQNESQIQMSEDTVNQKFSFNIGLYGGYSYNSNSANFMQLPNVPNCCLEYNGGTGSGYGIGALFGMPLFDKFALQLKLGFLSFNNKMTREEFIGNGQYQSQVVEVLSMHNLTTDYSYLTMIPRLIYRPSNKYKVFLAFGLDMGLKIASNYTQNETINSAAFAQGITYSDGSTIRNSTNGSLDAASKLYFGINAGLGYDFEITDKLTLSPEINYGLALSDLVTGISWKTSMISGNISIAYQMDISSSTKYIRDTVRVISEPVQKPVAEKTYDQSELKNYKCHYIVYSSFKSEEEAIQTMVELEKLGLKNLSTEIWIDEFTNKTFHRLRSECYNSLYTANQLKNEQMKLFRNVKLPNSPAIKSK